MYTARLSWSSSGGWRSADAHPVEADLLVFFGIRSELASGDRYRELKEMLPAAAIMGCSSGSRRSP
jgi:hypothetical protein